MEFFSRKKQIQNVYKELLGREADEDGLAHYFSSEFSIEEIEKILMSSDEYKDKILKTLKLDDYLIQNPRNTTGKLKTEFYDIDTAENFTKTKNKFGNDWIWSSKKIEYNINSYGYRMKEAADIDWKNYIAVFGCSFTVGIGLPIEETFSYKISNSLNYDLVNAAIAGSSNEFVLMNLSRLLSNKTAPKLVIINWTSLTRKCYWGNGKPMIYQAAYQAGTIWKKSYNNYLENSICWPYDFLELKRQVDVLCKIANIPCWHITNFSGYEFTDSVKKIIYDIESVGINHENIKYLNEYVARDFYIDGKHGHPGINLQNKIYDCWNEIKHNYGF